MAAAPLAVWAGEPPATPAATPAAASSLRLTLAECVNRALDRNPDVLVAKKKLEEAAGGIVEARAGYLPSLTTSGSYMRVEEGYMTLGGTLPGRRPELWSVAIRLTETIYSGGAVGGKMQIAKLTRQARLLEYEAMLDRVIMDTRVAFYEILQNKAQIAVHEQAVVFLESELQNQRNRQQVGSADRLPALRAEVSLSLERAALLEAKNRLLNSHAKLAELLAISAPPARSPRDYKQIVPSDAPAVPRPSVDEMAQFEVEGTLTYTKRSLDLSTCLAQALGQRPEVKAREKEIAIQKQQLIVDRSASKPKVDLFVGYDVVNEPNSAAIHSHYDGYLAGVAVTWQLFDGFLARGRVAATRARVTQAELAQEAAEHAIQTEVVQAFHDLKQAEETIQSQQQNVKLAEESLKLAQSNVALGLSTQLELLQARVDLTRAQTTELSARFTYNAALARLQRAISSHFTILEEPTRPAANAPASPVK
ncbi:MAG: TolC family protein [Verrucomicrobia bacterium]|nr:TolC family protein [Verrucomicrobiota bacterium]